MCDETRTAIISSVAIFCLAVCIGLAVYMNEISWRQAVTAGLQEKQNVGTSGKHWVK